MDRRPAGAIPQSTLIESRYSTGAYFADPTRHAEDAAFKVDAFVDALRALGPDFARGIRSYADVGCGSGDIVALLARRLREEGCPVESVTGYDVNPAVRSLDRPGVRFVHADFSTTGEPADLVTLFDVVEHVLDPGAFLRRVAARARAIALHIPLDDSWSVAARDRYRAKLADPGHVSFWDTAGALNLLTDAGLRVVDYAYTFGFLLPSGQTTRLARAASWVRRPLARWNPWLLSKTFGGVSLIVTALTPRGLAAADIEGHRVLWRRET